MSKLISAAYLVRRMMHTKRWGIINTSRQQTVPEHTCGVMILLDRMAIEDGKTSAEDHLALLRYALYHDAFEIVLFISGRGRHGMLLKIVLSYSSLV